MKKVRPLFALILGGMALVLKEPFGVNIGIAPWNAALLLGFRAVCAPIATGNTVV
jgi:acyl-CoA reductase-like NAD-dependent aldehyde dehydrogenase